MLLSQLREGKGMIKRSAKVREPQTELTIRAPMMVTGGHACISDLIKRPSMRLTHQMDGILLMSVDTLEPERMWPDRTACQHEVITDIPL